MFHHIFCKRFALFSVFVLMLSALAAAPAHAADYDVLNGSWKCDPKATLKLSGLDAADSDQTLNGFSMKVDAANQTLTFITGMAADQPYPFTFVRKTGNTIVLEQEGLNMFFEMQGGNNTVVMYPEGRKDEAIVFVRQ